MAENSPVVSKKRKLSTDLQKCCFCSKSANKTQNLIQLDSQKVENLLSICKSSLGKDDVSAIILENEEKIKNGTFSLHYHKNCRTKFMLSYYRGTYVAESSQDTERIPVQFTRSNVAEFDWKANCFICGLKCHEKKRSSWSLVESAVNNSSKLYSQVLQAAEVRNDREVLSRLLSTNGDLVAVEARYHRQKGCLSAYISQRNITASSSTPEKGDSTKIFELLKTEFHEALLIEKRVYELSILKQKFLEIAEQRKIAVNQNLNTTYFKEVLKKTWPELTFISRKGLTDLVCIDELSVEEAVKRAVTIETALNDSYEFDNFLDDDNFESKDDVSIVHKAAIILRNRILESTLQSTDKEYYASEEVTLEKQRSYLDPLLLKFVNWLSSKDKADNGEDINDEVDQKVVAIGSDITALIAPNRFTPKHLGLSVYLHHTFGSKKLIEDLNVLGHTLTYSEVRRFLTSAALYMSTSQTRTQSGAIVPTNVKSGENSGTLMVSVADNWDHNEHTLSGKQTTHAMTSILGKTIFLSFLPLRYTSKARWEGYT